jgi:hypothetical protein
MNHYQTIRDLIAPLGTCAEVYEPENCPGQAFVRFPAQAPVEEQQVILDAAREAGWVPYGRLLGEVSEEPFSITFHAKRVYLHDALRAAQQEVEELTLELERAKAKVEAAQAEIAAIPSDWPDWVSPYGNR